MAEGKFRIVMLHRQGRYGWCSLMCAVSSQIAAGKSWMLVCSWSPLLVCSWSPLVVCRATTVCCDAPKLYRHFVRTSGVVEVRGQNITVTYPRRTTSAAPIRV